MFSVKTFGSFQKIMGKSLFIDFNSHKCHFSVITMHNKGLSESAAFVGPWNDIITQVVKQSGTTSGL